jgi:hypothetical protein
VRRVAGRRGLRTGRPGMGLRGRVEATGRGGSPRRSRDVCAASVGETAQGHAARGF